MRGAELDERSAMSRVQVSEELQKIVGRKEASKYQAIHAVWKYINANHLHDFMVPMRVVRRPWSECVDRHPSSPSCPATPSTEEL